MDEEVCEYIIYKIQKIDDDGGDCYVGSTKAFKKRMSKHQDNCNHVARKKHNIKLYQHIRSNGGWECYAMTKLETKNITKREALILEQHYIDLLKPSMNTYSLAYTGLTQKEYHKQRFIKNKEKILLKIKEYYTENKEEIALKQKQYYTENKKELALKSKQYNAKNKEKIALYRNEQTSCQCGGRYTYCHKSAHMKCKKHINYIKSLATP